MSALPLAMKPYKGLIPYSEEDAAYFFGREGEREIITANLIASRLTLLYGASGVGKSSVLRARVAHNLHEETKKNLAERGTPEFVVIIFSSWRDDPIRGLTVRIQDSVMRTFNGQAFAFLPPQPTLTLTLQAWTERIHGDLIIILDQFEEYFLYHAKEDGVGTFAFEFAQAVNKPDLRVNFLVSIREDALAKLDRFKGKIPNLFDNYLRLEHLGYEAARSAIIGPVREFNRHVNSEAQFEVEDKLVSAVLDQVKTGQVILGDAGRGITNSSSGSVHVEAPFLQLVMTRLWDEEVRSGSHMLRLETLERLGGADHIVKTHLDEMINALSPTEQNLASRVFHFLVTPSGTKIAHTISDLAQYAGTSRDQLLPILNKLTASEVRILRPVAPPPEQPGEPRYEIFHDVLAPAILEWRTRNVLEQERTEAAHRLESERQRVTRLRMTLIGVLLVLLAVIALALWAFQQQRYAQSRELAALSVSTVNVDPELSILLALRSVNTISSAEGEDALRHAVFASHLRKVFPVSDSFLTNHVAYDASGKRVVTASKDGTARIWDVTTGNQLVSFSGHGDEVLSASFSPDGKYVVSTSIDPIARIWDSSTRVERMELVGHTDLVRSAAYSSDGKRIVTASQDHTARVWDAESGKELLRLDHIDQVVTAAFSPDGKWIATGGRGCPFALRLWDSTTGEMIGSINGHTDTINNLAFRPDGKMIATASSDLTVRLWDISDINTNPITGTLPYTVTGLLCNPSKDVTSFAIPHQLAILRGHTDGVLSVAFSPDGKQLVTAGNDRTVRIWDVETADEIDILRGHQMPVQSVAFSPDGKQIASTDREVRIWDNGPGSELAILQGHSREVLDVNYSHDGQRIVTASADGTARIWDVSGLSSGERELLRLPGGIDMTAAVFSPDGKRVVTGNGDVKDIVRIWDANTGERLGVLQGHSGPVRTIVFDTAGKRILTGSDDKTARIWNVDTGVELLTLRGHDSTILGVNFSPDGNQVVTASADRTVRVWDSSTGKELLTLRGHTDWVRSAVYSPDGRRIVTASKDHTARIWEVSTGREIMILRGHADEVTSAVYSPSGQEILTASFDQTTRVWDANTGRELNVFRGSSSPLTKAVYSPDGKQFVTANWNGSVEVFVTQINDLIAIALKRVTRDFSCEEQQQYLGENVSCERPVETSVSYPK